MSTAALRQKPDDRWTVVVERVGGDRTTLGAGVVVDRNRVLTCAHVVRGAVEGGADVCVRFPKAGVARSVQRRVRDVRFAADAEADVAVLVLAEDVPDQVVAAPLRSPMPVDLLGQQWWAFGFPDDEAGAGAEAHGTIYGERAYGSMLLQTESRYPVRPGFSGGGLWSPRYAAVVGLIGRAKLGGEHPGDAIAVTIRQVMAELPDENLAAATAWQLTDAGETALAAWGWSLTTDSEAGRHWRPRGRGVTVDSERGYRFRGRTQALQRLVAHLDRVRADSRVLVVTGSPGVGKSAVLGRIVTTADPGVRAQLPQEDTNVRAALRSVSCAVHAKGKTAMDVAMEIAQAASARLPEEIDEFVPAMREVLGLRAGGRFNVVIDALDEAVDANQARQIINRVVVPLVQTCWDVGAQVLVGTRRRDDGGELVGAFGTAADVVDLDLERYFSPADLAAYAQATLQLVGAERHDNPYADDAVARPVAWRIAALAERNFLIAALVARAHGHYDAVAIEPTRLTFDATVDAAFNDYLHRLPSVGAAPARLVLSALAFAQVPGMSAGIWSVVLTALGARVDPAELAAFAGSSAANFLIETSDDAGIGQFRLFHQALNDALLRQWNHRPGGRRAVERDITHRLIMLGRGQRWTGVDRYLRLSLPTHADRAGEIDALLGDDDYLLTTDLTRLVLLAERAGREPGQLRARLLQLTPRAIAATADERAALFSVTQALEHLRLPSFGGRPGAPYRAGWAVVASRVERMVLDGHTAAVNCVCPVNVDGVTQLASAGLDATVRVWDIATGRQERVLTGHRGAVHAIAQVNVDGSSLLASGGADGTVRIWNPATGHVVRAIDAHVGEINAICQIVVSGSVRLAAAGQDNRIRVWDPATGRLEQTLRSDHGGEINALCTVAAGGLTHLASAGRNGLVQLWDPATQTVASVMTGSGQPVYSLQALHVGDREILVGTCRDRIRFWDPDSGEYLWKMWRDIGVVEAVCPVTADGQPLLASVIRGETTIRLRQFITGGVYRTMRGHAGTVHALSRIEVRGRPLLASASGDSMVRLWDTNQRRAAPESDGDGSPTGHRGAVHAIARLTDGRGTDVATAGADGTVRIWDVATGGHTLNPLRVSTGIKALCVLEHDGANHIAVASYASVVYVVGPEDERAAQQFATHTVSINALAAVRRDRRPYLIGGSQNGTLWRWEPLGGRLSSTRAQRRPLESGPINALTTFAAADGELLIAGADRTLQIVDPETLGVLGVLTGHEREVKTITTFALGDTWYIASGGADRTILLWDLQSGREVAALAGHTGTVTVVTSIRLGGRVLLVSGSADRTLRVWDPQTLATLLSIPVYHPVLGCTCVDGRIVAALSAGVLTIELRPDGP